MTTRTLTVGGWVWYAGLALVLAWCVATAAFFTPPAAAVRAGDVIEFPTGKVWEVTGPDPDSTGWWLIDEYGQSGDTPILCSVSEDQILEALAEKAVRR